MRQRDTVFLVGGDARNLYLCELLQRAGYPVQSYGLRPDDRNRPLQQSLDEAALVVLSATPMPDDLIPAVGGAIPLQQVLQGCGAHVPVVGNFARQATALPANLVDLNRNETYLTENAHLTAQAAVGILLQESPLCGHTCLVCGLGRIGLYLCHLLMGLGATVYAAARSATQRALAAQLGAQTLPLQDAVLCFSRVQTVCNTVPAPLFDRVQLALLPAGCRLLELASPPYCCDLALAQQLGIRARLCNALPGRYYPNAAAETLFRQVRALLEKGGES